MANKEQLREQRKNTIINATAKKQETSLIKVLNQVVEHLVDTFSNKITLIHEKQWELLCLVNVSFHLYALGTVVILRMIHRF